MVPRPAVNKRLDPRQGSEGRGVRAAGGRAEKEERGGGSSGQLPGDNGSDQSSCKDENHGFLFQEIIWRRRKDFDL